MKGLASVVRSIVDRVAATRAWVPVAALAMVTTSIVWGRRLQARVVDVRLGAAPLVGRWHWRTSWKLAPAIAIGVLVVTFGPSLARHARFWVVALVSSIAATAFSVALAAADGGAALLAPVVHPTEYWDNLDILPPAKEMLRQFGTREFLVDYSPHLKGHPPGFILLLKALVAVGLRRPWIGGAISMIGVALLSVGVLVAIRAVVGDDVARRYAPFLVAAPFTVWLMTSADAFYAGVFAIGVAFVAVGSRATSSALGSLLCAFGGVVLGLSAFLSYGVVALAPIPMVMAFVRTRTSWPARLARLGFVAVGAVAVVAVFRLYGFWWFDGLRTTRGLYWEGTAKFRPWTYFLIGNLGALLLALGPAFSFGLARLRDRRVWLPVGTALACVALADVSQYSKGEVERIWLSFMPWLLLAVVALRRSRLWLVTQTATAVVLQAWLVSKW